MSKFTDLFNVFKKNQSDEKEFPEDFTENENEPSDNVDENELIIHTPEFFFESANSVSQLFKKKQKDDSNFFGIDRAKTNGFASFFSKSNDEISQFNSSISSVMLFRTIADSDELSDIFDEIVGELLPESSESLSIKLTEEIDMSGEKEVSDVISKITPQNEKAIEESFKKIIKRILPIDDSQMFDTGRQMYVDGGGFFIINRDSTVGLKEIIFVDILKIVKIIEGDETKFYYIQSPKLKYESKDFNTNQSKLGLIEIPKNKLLFITTGKLDIHGFPVSELKKVVRPFNNFRMVENSVLISIFAAAPEKYVFKIGTNGLSKPKKDELLKKLSEEYAINLSMDAESGQVNYKSKNLSIREHYWFTESAGQSHSLESLSSNNKIAEPEYLDKFSNKLITSTHLPLSRRQENSMYNFGRVQEIDNQEKNFFKWKKRKRRFIESLIFNLMKIDLQAKNVFSFKEFDKVVAPRLQIGWGVDDRFENMKKDAAWQSKTDLYSAIRQLIDDGIIGEEYAKTEILQLDEKARKGAKKTKSDY